MDGSQTQVTTHKRSAYQLCKFLSLVDDFPKGVTTLEHVTGSLDQFKGIVSAAKYKALKSVKTWKELTDVMFRNGKCLGLQELTTYLETTIYQDFTDDELTDLLFKPLRALRA